MPAMRVGSYPLDAHQSDAARVTCVFDVKYLIDFHLGKTWIVEVIHQYLLYIFKNTCVHHGTRLEVP